MNHPFRRLATLFALLAVVVMSIDYYIYGMVRVEDWTGTILNGAGYFFIGMTFAYTQASKWMRTFLKVLLSAAKAASVKHPA